MEIYYLQFEDSICMVLLFYNYSGVDVSKMGKYNKYNAIRKCFAIRNGCPVSQRYLDMGDKLKKTEKIRTYYESKMGQGLPDYSVLGWESEKAQQLRFDMLLKAVSLDGKSLLDVGCGMGNLLEYLDSKGISVKYTGVDILGSMIEYAECKKLKGEFCCVDVFDGDSFDGRTFDIVYTSGIFNLNLGNNREFLFKALKKMLELADEAVVFNLLHKDSPAREEKYFYYDQEEVSKLLKDFPGIEKVIINEQYLNNDFTVVCYKKRSSKLW